MHFVKLAYFCISELYIMYKQNLSLFIIVSILIFIKLWKLTYVLVPALYFLPNKNN